MVATPTDLGKFVKTILISEVGVILFGARNCHSAGLVHPFWEPGGPFWQLGGTLGSQTSSRRNTLGSGVGFLTILWSESGRVELGRQRFRVRWCAKN